MRTVKRQQFAACRDDRSFSAPWNFSIPLPVSQAKESVFCVWSEVAEQSRHLQFPVLLQRIAP
jgi:hypothetical protein